MAAPRDLKIAALSRPTPFCCAGAARFAAGITKLLADVRGDPADAVAVNRAKLWLLDRFMAERVTAPPGHRDRILDASDRPCLYGLFLAGYAELRELELTADPPPLSYPQPLPSLPEAILPQQAMGLLLNSEV